MPVSIGVEGVGIGHWTDLDAQTGCTVIVLPEGTVASAEVRGGAPATREFELLASGRLVEHVDAIVLTGGSAFGLAAADGVMDVLESEGRGFPTPFGRVPIVVAMALYDLGVGSAFVRPGPNEGRRAALNRSPSSEVGAVGAGTGATTSKWLGASHARQGGLGVSTVGHNDIVVTAVVALNAAGSTGPESEATIRDLTAGTFDGWPQAGSPMANTTLCAIVTNAALTKLDCHWVAQGGHDGLARALVPAHTRFDGDAVVVAATGETQADVDEVRLMTVAAVADAVAIAAGY